MISSGEYEVKFREDISLAEWVDFQLYVLGEYGFNQLDIHFFSDREIEQDSYIGKGSFESFESGFLGDSLSWSEFTGKGGFYEN